jgi:hypothetical protein
MGQLGRLLDVAVDSTQVYWSVNESPGAIMKLPLAGGAPVALASNQVYPGALAVDAGNLYWITGDVSSSIVMAPADGSDGGAPITLYSSATSAFWSLAFDADYIYWAEFDNGTLMKMGKAAGSQATTVLSGQPGPDTIAVDATHIYWTSDDGIMRVEKTGGTPALFAPSYAYRMVLDATHAYWLDPDAGKLRKLAK